ncbi:lipase family protein [Nitrosomonas aestuarii]|uniref:lipase family protein n=1 Tax=Nitrosomonas aestuarii TaxID=52441 RepID=UPI000D3152B0|nr:lipase [Nitrosomonas aestuarii]PTN12840.1 lipase (class 3) [Nitrosomonas aestuarii]
MFRNSNFIGLLIGICCFLIIGSPARAVISDCIEQEAPAAFFVENGLLCLQKITVAEQPGTTFYKAALTWSGPDNPNQFRLLNAEPDQLADQNSPIFSTVDGSLIIPRVDIPRTFGTERYVANLVLVDDEDLSVFKLASVTLYINPDFVPNVTWKPYGMLDSDERHAVDLLGRSIPYAKLADAVYDFDNKTIDQWVLFEKKDKNSGMQAAVYYNPETDEVVLAFRGTETCDFPCSLSETAEFFLDTAADSLLTFGFVDTQFADAVDYAQDVVNRAQGRKIIVTGHSLGGGLAQAIGAALGLETFAFNSAPVPDDFFKDYPRALSPEMLSEIIHVIGDIHDPVSNTDETGKLYQNADHVSSLIQFDFDLKEILPAGLKQLNDLRFNRHSITRLVDNASSLLAIYRDGW